MFFLLLFGSHSVAGVCEGDEEELSCPEPDMVKIQIDWGGMVTRNCFDPSTLTFIEVHLPPPRDIFPSGGSFDQHFAGLCPAPLGPFPPMGIIRHDNVESHKKNSGNVRYDEEKAGFFAVSQVDAIASALQLCTSLTLFDSLRESTVTHISLHLLVKRQSPASFCLIV